MYGRGACGSSMSIESGGPMLVPVRSRSIARPSCCSEMESGLGLVRARVGSGED